MTQYTRRPVNIDFVDGSAYVPDQLVHLFLQRDWPWEEVEHREARDAIAVEINNVWERLPK